MSAMTIEQECGDPHCPEYGTPDGPDNNCPDEHILDRHPGADPNWRPSTYRYHDDKLAIVHLTQVPIDDESALAYFHRIARWGRGWQSVSYVAKAEPGSKEFQMLPFRFEGGEVKSL